MTTMHLGIEDCMVTAELLLSNDKFGVRTVLPEANAVDQWQGQHLRQYKPLGQQLVAVHYMTLWEFAQLSIFCTDRRFLQHGKLGRQDYRAGHSPMHKVHGNGPELSAQSCLLSLLLCKSDQRLHQGCKSWSKGLCVRCIVVKGGCSSRCSTHAGNSAACIILTQQIEHRGL